MKKLWSLILLAVASSVQAPAAQNGVPDSLMNKLKTGVNVTGWFGYVPKDADAKHYESYLNDQDFNNFKRLHVSFVRLCMSPDLVIKGDTLNQDVFPYIDKAIARFRRAGIAVIFDLHDNGQLKLDQPDGRSADFQTFWHNVATRYKGRNEREVIFELLNEPVYQKNPADWYKLQADTVSQVRAIDPARTIMVTSTSWSSIDTLLTMQTLPEKNLIYTFHCYDPFWFTHQSATWAGEEVKHMKNMPFPSSPEAVAAIINGIDEKYRPIALEYGEKRYDDAYLVKRIGSAADWGKTNGVPVLLGEFGSYPPVSPPESRARWFSAMRKAIYTAGVANSIWGYDDGFGLGRRIENGQIWLDPLTLRYFFGVSGS